MMTGAVWATRAPAEAAPVLSSTPVPRRCDVVVVGGGITGVALLRALRERGVDAILCEREDIGSGASGRNAGFLLAGVAENYARACARYGREVAAEVWAFTLENHEVIAGWSAAAPAGYRRRGSMIVAQDEEEAFSLDEAAILLREDGFAVERRGPSRDGFRFGALFNPGDGEIDPLRLVRGVAAAHRDRIYEHHDVVAIDDGESTATVGVGDDTISAGAVFIATNAWTSQLAPAVDVRPVRAQMLATAPAAPCTDVPVYADWGHRYWRQLTDGRLLVGGFRHRAIAEETGFDATPTPTIQRHLDAQLAELGSDAAVTHRWAGIMGFSPDGLPFVGRVPGTRRLHVCAGYTGHGMGFAVNAAAMLTGSLLDGTALPSWIDVARSDALRRSPTAP